MDLTKKERLFLANQYKILEKLYPDEADYYEECRIAIEEGYKLHYDWAAEFIRDELSEKDCREVLNILEMFSTIVSSYRKLEDNTEIDESLICFPGFDGNKEEEVKRMSYVKYFIHTLKRYDELKHPGEYPDYNTHWPMLEIYRKMLKKWNSFGEDKSHLAKEQIIELLNIGKGRLKCR